MPSRGRCTVVRGIAGRAISRTSVTVEPPHLRGGAATRRGARSAAHRGRWSGGPSAHRIPRSTSILTSSSRTPARWASGGEPRTISCTPPSAAYPTTSCATATTECRQHHRPRWDCIGSGARIASACRERAVVTTRRHHRGRRGVGLLDLPRRLRRSTTDPTGVLTARLARARAEPAAAAPRPGSGRPARASSPGPGVDVSVLTESRAIAPIPRK